MNLNDIFVVLFSLIIIVLLIIVTYKGANWLNKRVKLTSGKIVTLVERINLGADKFIVVAKVANEYILLGVSTNSITKLDDLNKEQIDLIIENSSKQALQSDFVSKFINALSKQKKGGGSSDN